MFSTRKGEKQNTSVSPELRIIPSRQGAPTLLQDGLYLHSRHDPQKEAKNQVESIFLEDKSQIVLFIGGGLGYVLKEFYKRHPNPCIWFEPSNEVINLAFQYMALGDLLKSGRIKHIQHHSLHENQFQEIFQNLYREDIVFYIHRASLSTDPVYLNFYQEAEQYLNRKSVNSATMMRFDRLWTRNLFANFSILKDAHPIQELFSTCDNKAALICGAGPSLSQDIPYIKKYRDRFLLMASDTALRPLQLSRIDPDIVLSVDPQPCSFHYMEGYSGNAIFIVDPSVSYLNLRSFSPHKIYYFWSPFPLGGFFFDYLKNPPEKIAFGGSVVTNAYDLAVQMNCSPIFLAGMDLSFTGGLAHSRGAALESLCLYKQSRVCYFESHNYQQLTALPSRLLNGKDGNPVLTNDKLLLFHQWLENRFHKDKQRGIKIVNLSSQGAEISSICNGSWNDCDNLPRLSLPTLAKQIKHSANHFPLASFLKGLEKLKKDFLQYKILVKEGLVLGEQILYQAKKNTKTVSYSKMLQKMNEIDSKILHQKGISSIVGTIMQKVIFQFSRKKNQSNSEGRNEDIFVAERSLKFYQALLDSVYFYQKNLKKTSRRFKLLV